MELRQLEYFAAVCEEMHFTRAADKLGITQPTLSHQIKALEDEIGTPLFDRIGKKIALTEAGFILKSHTRVMFNTLHSAKEQIQELHDGDRGMLTIGCLPGELNHLVTLPLVEFNKQFPNIKIRIVADEDVAAKVVRNELDAALTIFPAGDNRLEQVPLYEEQFYLIAPKGHMLTKRKKIDFDEVKKLPVIMFPESHKCRQLLEATSCTLGFPLEPAIETNTIDSIFNLVKSGAGISILSKSLIDLHNDGSLEAIPVVNPSVTREVGVIYCQGKFLSRAANAYIDMLQQFIIRNKVGNRTSSVRVM
ncbi:LysR family transcriptional regulator [Paenibacillus sp. R14(2021)]|uniref:LysR family transcriptional regulator n=1 Tax=Paenibacillus sp. R14(2021) TaxID=2859228 RepID=UPI001C61447D|nr:LysR family transcriptional regulator [Paenibacillus sp. R14(2021)]